MLEYFAGLFLGFVAGMMTVLIYLTSRSDEDD